MSAIQSDVATLQISERIAVGSSIAKHPASELFDCLQIEIAGLDAEIALAIAQVSEVHLDFRSRQITPEAEPALFDNSSCPFDD